MASAFMVDGGVKCTGRGGPGGVAVWPCGGAVLGRVRPHGDAGQAVGVNHLLKEGFPKYGFPKMELNLCLTSSLDCVTVIPLNHPVNNRDKEDKQ